MNCYQVLVLLVLVTTAEKSFAKTGYGPGDQEWGYVNVREGAHMFYWLYKTTTTADDYKNRPLIIQLGSGTGNSIDVDVNGTNHNTIWVKDVNVLYIDSPVGSGFSYVKNESYYATNNRQVALDLVECMKAFFNRHKEFEEIPLHIFTKSYGGKMAPEFALELYNANQRGEIKCRLVSLAMGNPFTSPIDAVSTYAYYLYYSGVVDEYGYFQISALVDNITKFINAEEWENASHQLSTTLQEVSGSPYHVNVFNIQKAVPQDDDIELSPIYVLMRGNVSEALGIPDDVKWNSNYQDVYLNLKDFMKSAVHTVSEILNTTDLKVAVYSGQLNFICNTAGTLSWIQKLEWNERNEYFAANRDPVYVNGVLEGYEQAGGKLSMFWVNRAGSSVPVENPAAMSYILKKVTNFDKK